MPGVRWHVDQVIGPVGLALPLAEVRDRHLRVVNGTEDDGYITSLIYAAEREGERIAWRSFLEQTLRLVVDTVPADGVLVLPGPPVIAVEEVKAGATVLTAGEYGVEIPVGPSAGFARVMVAASGPLAVTYRAGYVQAGSPPVGEIPRDLQVAMLLVIGELYKTRTLSVQGTSTIPAVIQARAIFEGYRPY